MTALKDMDFKLMHKTYYISLCRYAEGLIKQKEDAEDVVSNLFLILWENQENIHIKKSLISFLYKSVRNNSLKFMQHKKIMCAYCEHFLHMRTNGDRLLIHDNDDPMFIMIMQDLETKMDHAINALPKKCREVFDLVRIEELKYQEVADRLGITIGTVRKQVNRAMTKIQDSFENI